MGNIYNHLDMIKKRPGMYIGGNKINLLDIYLVGYYGCLFEKGIQENETPDFSEFNDWIANYFGYKESTSGWKNMILDNSTGEEEALKTFFTLLEEFKNEKK